MSVFLVSAPADWVLVGSCLMVLFCGFLWVGALGDLMIRATGLAEEARRSMLWVTIATLSMGGMVYAVVAASLLPDPPVDPPPPLAELPGYMGLLGINLLANGAFAYLLSRAFLKLSTKGASVFAALFLIPFVLSVLCDLVARKAFGFSAPWLIVSLIFLLGVGWVPRWLPWWFAAPGRRMMWVLSVFAILCSVVITRIGHLDLTYAGSGVTLGQADDPKGLSVWKEAERQARSKDTSPPIEPEFLPPNDVLKFMALGHRTFMADMLFVRANLYFGVHLFSDRTFPWLDRYVEAIIAMDPDNPKIYEWASQVVKYGQLISPEVIAKSIRYSELGIKRFPDDWRFYRDIGFNLLFETKMSDAKARKEQLARALPYFRVATLLPNSGMDPNFMASLLERQNAHEAALSIIYNRYWEASPRQREAMQGRMTRFGQAATARALDRLEKRWKSTHPYVPVRLFESFDTGNAREGVLPGWVVKEAQKP